MRIGFPSSDLVLDMPFVMAAVYKALLWQSLGWWRSKTSIHRPPPTEAQRDSCSEEYLPRHLIVSYRQHPPRSLDIVSVSRNMLLHIHSTVMGCFAKAFSKAHQRPLNKWLKIYISCYFFEIIVVLFLLEVKWSTDDWMLSCGAYLMIQPVVVAYIESLNHHTSSLSKEVWTTLIC